MNWLLLALLLISICSSQAGRPKNDNSVMGNDSRGPCSKQGGQCVERKRCQIVLNETCPGSDVCCGQVEPKEKQKVLKKAKAPKKSNIDTITGTMEGDKVHRKKENIGKRECRSTPKKCSKYGGECTHYKDQDACLVNIETVLDKDLCRGDSCNCCIVTCEGSEKKKCNKKNGSCKQFCDSGEVPIKKGCKSAGCTCCAPVTCKASSKAKKSCTNKGGYCVTRQLDCWNGTLTKGCKPKGCHCCVSPLCDNPSYCKYEGRTGLCSTARIPAWSDTIDAGQQQCRDGCTCFVSVSPLCDIPRKCEYEGRTGDCSSDRIPAWGDRIDAGQQQCEDGCTCFVPAKTVRCGIEISASQRIVNGVNVTVARKYSWQVWQRVWTQLLDGSYFYYFCGGSIITDRHILTAAHCFYENTSYPGCSEKKIIAIYVGIGDHNQEITNDNLPDFNEPVAVLRERVKIHENYNCTTFENDIAIIELSKAIDLVKHADDIHPICLPKDDSKTYEGETATVIGWGSTVGYNPGTTPAPSPLSNVLQEAQITVRANRYCNVSFQNITQQNIPFQNMIFQNITSLISIFENLCAGTLTAGTEEGFENGGKGVCQGDSGGSIFVKENAQHVQIGVSSFSSGCAAKGFPASFTRVTYYLDWIKDQIGSETIYTLP